MKDLVIVPLYNEVDTVVSSLTEIRRHHVGDVLVVDDGSDDGSAPLIDAIGGLKVLRHAVNKGYGASLNDGFAYALRRGYDRVVTCDCDEQHEPRLIPTLFARLGESDILSGSRYLTETGENDLPPSDRLTVNRRITAIINDITGYRLTDGFCGFKGYKVAALAKLKLTEPGYAQPLQMWIQAAAAGLTVAEIPVPRIYKNLNRSFGEDLDDMNRRLAYYCRTIEAETVSHPLCADVHS
jgi:dolichol-phosphate mannosyltransferase